MFLLRILIAPLAWLDANTRAGQLDTQWLPRLLERVSFGRYDSSYDHYDAETQAWSKRK